MQTYNLHIISLDMKRIITKKYNSILVHLLRGEGENNISTHHKHYTPTPLHPAPSLSPPDPEYLC